MKTYLFYLLLALVTGALIPIQASTNAAFSKSIGNSFVTGFIVSIVALVAMSFFIVLSGTPWPTRQQLVAAPVYSYLGGVIVAVYVVMITVLVPRIGVGAAIGLIVTGQIICAAVIDHFGLFGAYTFPINISRAAGLALMITGIYLSLKK